MQYIYGIHAVDSLLRRNPRSVQRLWVQAGRQDRRIAALLELAGNQGVPVAREPKRLLDERVEGRHQGVVAETLDDPAREEGASSNVWREKQLLEAVSGSDHPVLILVLDGVTDPHNLGACLLMAPGVLAGNIHLDIPVVVFNCTYPQPSFAEGRDKFIK